MKYFNEVYFYDLDLNPLKTITIGNKTLPGLFNNATITNESYIHTVDMCATDTYIYIMIGGWRRNMITVQGEHLLL